MRLQTKTIHAGVDKDSAYNSIMTPIYQTSTFRFEDIGQTKGYDYTRTSNPTRKALEENITALEGGAGAVGGGDRDGCHCHDTPPLQRRATTSSAHMTATAGRSASFARTRNSSTCRSATST